MGELIRRVREFRFKGILVILLVFALMAAVLLVELSGIRANRYARRLELLPSEKIVTLAEALAAQPKSTLVLYNSAEDSSSLAALQLEVMLRDMKVGSQWVDLALDAVPAVDTYQTVILLLSDLSVLGESLSALCDWI